MVWTCKVLYMRVVFCRYIFIPDAAGGCGRAKRNQHSNPLVRHSSSRIRYCAWLHLRDVTIFFWKKSPKKISLHVINCAGDNCAVDRHFVFDAQFLLCGFHDGKYLEQFLQACIFSRLFCAEPIRITRQHIFCYFNWDHPADREK